MQASKFTTTAQRGGRKKIKVPGRIEMNPRVPEITMAVTGKIPYRPEEAEKSRPSTK